MKILAVSDVEEPVLYEELKQAKIGNIDLIISCGDLKASYLSYLATVYKAPLFFVRGNHDTAIQTLKIYDSGLVVSEEELNSYQEMAVGENLHNKIVKYKGLNMMGFEGAPDYTRNAIQYTERMMAWMTLIAQFKTLFQGIPDIIVTHAPPKGIHDGTDYAHRGFPAYTKLIQRLKPKYFLHGHTHLNYDRNQTRITKVEETLVINVYGYYLLEF